MKYWLWLRNPDPEGDFCVMFRGETPAHIRPELIEHTYDRFVDERLKLCKDCHGSHCHVIEEETGRKFCPILFSDLVKPGWTAKDLDSNIEGGSDSPWARAQLNGKNGESKEAGMEQAGITMLKLTELRPMENYRKSMDEKKLAELTESVRTKGVVQPILVRPNGKGYEIVFGQRRWMASKRAGLLQIPAMIRKVTDEEALELQVIENSQREDPNPMEEGIGFKKLMETGKHTAETLAAKLDKSADYVLGRTKLLVLPKDIQDRIINGTIPIGHALQLTRLKNEGDMKKLAQDMVSRDMNLRDVKYQLSHYSTEMRKAEFDTTACHNCPARSKTQTAFFPDATKQDGDVCMDKSCFFTKTKAHWGVQAAALRNMGVKVYTKALDDKFLKGNREACQISPTPDNASYRIAHPKLYKQQCSKCEKRAFAWFEKKLWNNSRTIETQWFCLEKKCLHKMNRVKPSPAEMANERLHTPAGRVSSRQHAQECRDRFLYREVAPRVEKSQALQLRLAIYYLLEHFDELSSSLPWEKDKGQDERKTRSSIFNEITGRKISTWFTSTDYAAIAGLPEKQLMEALLKVARASVKHTDPDVLLLMVPEAGIDLNKSLLIDKDYLNSKTKAELVKLAKPLGINARTTTFGKPLDQLSKPETLEEILKHDLTGHLPKDLAGEFRLKELAALGGKKAKA